MERSCGCGWWFDVAWVLAFGLASSVWCLTAATKLGATFDEPFYLNAGMTAWRTGSNKLMMSSGTMPLTVDVQTLPIYLWERQRGQEFHVYKDIETILPVARAATLLFWWPLLVYALLLGRTFGGPWAGRLAVGFIACDPNMLGHASLATTDIAIVASMFALIYHYYHGQGKCWGQRVVLPGVLFGVATLTKASGMVFGVQAILILGLIRLYRTGELTKREGKAPAEPSYAIETQRPARQEPRPPGDAFRHSRIGRIHLQIVHIWHAAFQLRKDLFWIMLIGFTLTFAYVGCDWGVEGSFVEWAEQLPHGELKEVMVPLSRTLTIFPNAGEALLQQIRHNIRGHGTFLLGHYYERATPTYFPIALTIKTPAPMLALLLVVLMIRPRNLLTPIGGIALMLLAFSLNCRVQIGIRFMFTLMAVGYVTLAVAVVRTWSEPSGGRFIPRWFVGTLLAIMAGTAAWVWPHGLSYTNQLWGGVEHGYRHLSDSNYDWGQGVQALKEWNREHNGEQPLGVWYFGTDPAILFPPFKAVYVNGLIAGTPEELRTAAGTRYFAVSTSLLYGHESELPGHMAALRRFRDAKPVGRTQHFFIYDLWAL